MFLGHSQGRSFLGDLYLDGDWDVPTGAGDAVKGQESWVTWGLHLLASRGKLCLALHQLWATTILPVGCFYLHMLTGMCNYRKHLSLISCEKYLQYWGGQRRGKKGRSCCFIPQQKCSVSVSVPKKAIERLESILVLESCIPV